MFLLPKTSWSRLAGLLACVILAACTKDKGSSVSVRADYLYVSGVVTNGKDNPVSGVDIFLPGVPEPLGFSDDSGEFGVTLSDGELAKARGNLAAHEGVTPQTFRLIFSRKGDVELSGLAPELSFESRGERDVGQVILAEPASLRGTIERVPEDGDISPAAGAQIYAGIVEGRAAEDGSFLLTGLPPGRLRIAAAAPDLAPGFVEIDLEPGSEQELPHPIALFPHGSVAAQVRLTPVSDSETQAQAGHPYRRTYAVARSSAVAYMRYHHDRDTFDAKKGEAAWQPVKSVFDYDFPGNGAYTLYVQFADRSKERTSAVLSVVTPVDIFPDAKGIRVGDGSGIVRSRSIMIETGRPHAAMTLRVSHDPLLLLEAPWQPAEDLVEYMLPRPIGGRSSQTYTLYLQFGDVAGNLSLVYTTTVTLQVFPELDEPVLVIGDGWDLTDDMLVPLTIKVPENAYQMRVFEAEDARRAGVDIGGINVGGVNIGGVQAGPGPDNPFFQWVPVRPNYFHTFRTHGPKQLFVQFRDIDGLESNLYSATIRVLPFEHEGEEGFVINGGAPTTTLREVALTLIPPSGAIAFRVAENQAPAGPWSKLEPVVPFVLQGTGTREIQLQYQNIDGGESLIYRRSIHVDPFIQDPGDFIINYGAPFSDSPVLLLTIMPPLAATEMLIAERFPDGQSVPFRPEEPWQHIEPEVELFVNGAGTKTITIKFRNQYGDESPLIARTIIYDPFPPGAGGILIEQGHPVTFERNVRVDLLLPPSAAGMFISTHLSDFQSPFLPFRELEPTIWFTLPDSPGTHTLYVQFVTLDGDLSPIYVDQIELNLFPAPYLQVEINGGAAKTTNSVLELKLTPPPAATGIKIAESPTDLLLAPILTVSDEMTFEVSATPGRKTLYLQYVSESGKTSNVFTGSIELESP